MRDVSAIQSALALDVDDTARSDTAPVVAAPVQSAETTPALDEDRRDSRASSMPEPVPPAEPPRETVRREEPDAGEAEERVPMPWAPSSKRPIRQGPAGQGDADSQPPDEPDDQPLITNEELSALLGPERTRAREATDEGHRESEPAS